MSPCAATSRDRRSAAGAAGLLLTVLALAVPAPAAAAGTFVQIVPVAGQLAAPLGVTHSGDGSGRLFVVERCGKIRILEQGQVLPAPFLDLGATGADRILCGDERGLLGLAFHPGYETNGRFYVYYTRKSDGDIVIARYQASANPRVANPASEAVLLVIEHSSQTNHNGGHLAFGPDGYLYAAVGDGGGGGDFLESGQSLATLLGKILRLDVDGGSPYAIPAGNPFAGATPGRDEIWAYGLRNPWRFSFDRQTGDLYIGDVGQQTWEEIDFAPAASPGGVNYGWDCREGAHAFNDTNGDNNASCPGSGFTDPVLEYDHSLGCSVTGGHVFRNLSRHALTGSYLYADFCSGRIWRGRLGAGGWSSALLFDTALGISSFGESESGRIYLTDLFGGALHWVAPHTFRDAPPGHWAWAAIETLGESGITRGCAADDYCPARAATRAETATLLVRALHGADFVPPPATGARFQDVPASHWTAAFIEQAASDGITRGCQATPALFCPDQPVTRAEMAALLLRAKHGASFVPPPGGGTVFTDVPAGHWAVDWIEQLAAEGITTGCGGGKFCPEAPVSRAEMAVFLARTFSLPLP